MTKGSGGRRRDGRQPEWIEYHLKAASCSLLLLWSVWALPPSAAVDDELADVGASGLSVSPAACP
jgi:hypothetical protein